MSLARSPVETSLLAAAATLLALALPISIAAANIGLGLFTAAVLFSRPDRAQLKDPVVPALLLYLAAAALSASLSAAPAESLRAVLKDSHKLWVLGVLLLGLRPQRRALLALAAGFAFVAVVGVAQTIPGAPLVVHDWTWRAHAFVHAVTFGEQMALAALGGLCFFGRKEAGLDCRAARIATALFIVLCAAALALSRTRGAAVGLAAGLAAGALIDRKLLRWTPLLLVGAVAFYLRHNAAGASSVLESRSVLWDVAWRIFKDHPAIGVGPGQYRAAFPHYFSGKLEGDAVWGSAHNLYLHQLAERGLLGLCALALLLGLMLLESFRDARRNPTAWRLWAFAAMAAFLVMNVTEVAFQVEQVTALVLFIWAWGRNDGSEAEIRPA